MSRQSIYDTVIDGNMKLDDLLAALAAAHINLTRPDAEKDVLIKPEGYSLVDLEQYAPHPKSNENTRRFFDPESLIAYVTRYGDADTAVYLDRENKVIDVVLDHSKADQAQWENHRAFIRFEHSRQYNQWINRNEQQMAQAKFADMLEDRQDDIRSPDLSDLTQIIDNFRLNSRREFASEQRRSSGERSVVFSTKQTECSVTVPESFMIAIPIFSGNDERIAIKAMLRYDVNTDEKKVQWCYRLMRVDDIVDKVFDDLAAQVIEGLSDVTENVYRGRRASK